MKKTIESMLALILILSTVFGFVKLVSPVDSLIEPLDEQQISPVGPGQEITLKFERKTEESIYWDSIELVNQIDSDWITQSSLDSNFLYYSIQVPPNKPAGSTSFRLKVKDKESAMNPNEIEVKVYVTRDPDDLIEVIKFEEEPNLYAGQPGNATFKIRNRALSTATYNVEVFSKDLPKVKQTKVVSVEPKETKEVNVPITFPTEDIYSLEARVWSPDIPAINEKVNTTAYVRPTLQSKLNSIGKGFPLIPLTMAPFYSVLGIIGF